MNETQSQAKPNTKRDYVMNDCLKVEKQYLQNLQELNEVTSDKNEISRSADCF